MRVALDDSPVALGRSRKVSKRFLFDLRDLVEQHPFFCRVGHLREAALVESP